MNIIPKNSLLIALMILTSAMMSVAQLRLTFYMNAHPDPFIANWAQKKNTLICTITNTGAKYVAAKFDCKINRNGVLQANTKLEVMKTLQIPASGVVQYYAEELMPFEKVKVSGGADRTAVTTGMLPAGTYEFCVTLVDPVTNAQLTTPVCRIFMLVSYQAPVLLQPFDKSQIDKGKRPMLRWSRVSPTPTNPVMYRVMVFEILKGQTAPNAYKVNRAILNQKVLMPQLLWPADVDLPRGGMSYVWSVQALDDNGNYFGENKGTATPFTFTMCCAGDGSGSDGKTPGQPGIAGTAKDTGAAGNKGKAPSSGVQVDVLHGGLSTQPAPHGEGHGVSEESTSDEQLTEGEVRTDSPMDSVMMKSPSRKSPTRSLTPSFSWSANTNVKNIVYRLRLVKLTEKQYLDPQTGLRENAALLTESDLAATSLNYPAGATQLEEGEVYAWTVDAYQRGSTLPVTNAHWPTRYRTFVAGNTDTAMFACADCEYECDGACVRTGAGECYCLPYVDQASTEQPIELLSPNEKTIQSDARPEFKFRAPKNKNVESFTLKIYEIRREKGEYLLDTTHAYVVVRGLKQQTWKYTPDAPPLDSTKFFAWTVEAVGNGRSLPAPAPVTPFSPCCGGPPPCMCALNFGGNNYTINVCQGQPFPVISGNFYNCSGPISNVWSPAPNSSTLGTATYTCTVTNGTMTCPYTVVVTVIAPTTVAATIEICSPETSPSTECCGLKHFRLRKTSSSCTAVPTFPSGTTRQWYIIRTSTMPPPIVTPPAFPTGNPCLTGVASTMLANIWYKFGSGGVNQAFPGTPAELPANSSSSESYYVTCKIDYPGGYSPTCVQSGLTNNYIFRVVSTNSLSANISTTAATCGFNGTIIVNSVAGGTGPYTLTLNSGTPVTPSTYPYTFTNVWAAASHVVTIHDANGCAVSYTELVNWAGPSAPIISTSPPNTHSITCNGSLILTANVTGGPYTYQWYKCINCGACTSCNSCLDANYVPITGQTSSTLNTSVAGCLPPACYRVHITDANGGCNTSLPWRVTSPNPPTPVITGPSIICNTGSTATLTSSGTGTATLQWYLNNVLIPGATASSLVITGPGTYSVTATVIVSGQPCTSTTTWVVAGEPCNCHNCNYTKTVSITTDGSYMGIPRYLGAVHVVNAPDCRGNISLQMGHPAEGTLLLPGATYLTPVGNSAFTFEFTSTVTSGNSVDIVFLFAWMNGVLGTGANCTSHVLVTIP